MLRLGGVQSSCLSCSVLEIQAYAIMPNLPSMDEVLGSISSIKDIIFKVLPLRSTCPKSAWASKIHLLPPA